MYHFQWSICHSSILLLFQGWVQDKIRSKFALPGICWQKSFILKLVWQVGDSTSNIIESLHADANTEGTSWTLVGGMQKGQHFDMMKLQSLQVHFHSLLVSLLLCAKPHTSSRYLRQQVSDLHTSMVTYLTILYGV